MLQLCRQSLEEAFWTNGGLEVVGVRWEVPRNEQGQPHVNLNPESLPDIETTICIPAWRRRWRTVFPEDEQASQRLYGRPQPLTYAKLGDEIARYSGLTMDNTSLRWSEVAVERLRSLLFELRGKMPGANMGLTRKNLHRTGRTPTD